VALIFGKCLEEMEPLPPSHALEVSRSHALSLNPGYDGKSPEEVVPLPPSHDLMISKSQSLTIWKSHDLTLFHSSGPTAGKLEIRISKLETNPNVQNGENVQNTDGSRTSRAFSDISGGFFIG
jgi:hypothetical protein